MKKLLLFLAFLPLCAGAMNQQDLDNQLFDAAEEGSIHEVDRLLKAGADKDALNKHGNTPLHYAAQSGKTEAAKLLLDKGADKDALNKYGDTPLHNAAQYGNPEVVKLLLALSAGKEAVDSSGQTPLHVAAEFGQTDVARLLLAAGANKHAKDRYGYTPLHLAAFDGLTDIVKLLLSYGADPLIKIKQSRTPLDTIQPNLWDNPDKIKGKNAVAQMLKEYEQLVQDASTNPTHETLTKAVEHGYALLVKQLLLKLKPTERQISTLGIIAKNNGHNKIGQILKSYAHALSLQHQTLVSEKLPVDVANTIAGYNLNLLLQLI